MKWLARLMAHFRRPDDRLLERADKVADVLDHRVVIVTKNRRALAELRRLEGHARR